MQPLQKQKYFYFIAFMLIASTFLPLVFNNLPPIIGSHHLWTIIWTISLIIFSPKILLNKAIAYLLVYGFFLFLATETIWSSIDDWNSTRLFFEFYEIVIGVTVITWFLQSKDYFRLAKITKWSLIFIFITAIMSIISSGIDPMYARNINVLSTKYLSINHYGGGTYSTAGAFMCLFPVLLYYFKNNKLSPLPKIQIIVFSLIVFYALLSMQIVGNIIIAVGFFIIALFGMKKIRQSIVVIVLFFSIALIIPKEVYVNRLMEISGDFEKYSELNYKLRDMANFIKTGVDINDNNTSTGARVERYPMLLKTFVKSPLLGCYLFSTKTAHGYDGAGAHLYWMNKLTVTGIIGFVFFLFIPYNFITNSLKYFNSTYKFYYILASISILSYGLMKVIGGRDTWYAFFIILPGFYYLPLLKKSNKKDSIPGDKRLVSMDSK
jgi:hypothetical protein